MSSNVYYTNIYGKNTYEYNNLSKIFNSYKFFFIYSFILFTVLSAIWTPISIHKRFSDFSQKVKKNEKKNCEKVIQSLIQSFLTSF